MDIYEEKFYEEQRRELLNEGLFSIGLGALAGALIVRSASKGKINKFFKKLFKKKEPASMDSFKGKPSVKREERNYDDMETKLQEVFDAIEQKDWEEARARYRNSKYFENDDAIKAIAMKITDVLGEPPMYLYPTGNQSYMALKTITNPKVGRAVSNAIVKALRANKSYYDDLKNIDIEPDEV